MPASDAPDGTRRISRDGDDLCRAILKDGILTIGNAGDSRAYLLRGATQPDHRRPLRRLAAGAGRQHDAGRGKTQQTPQPHQQVHRPEGDVEPDVDPIALEEGDTVLLCSDGLTTEVGDAEIARILASVPTSRHLRTPGRGCAEKRRLGQHHGRGSALWRVHAAG